MAERSDYLYWVGLAVTHGLGARLAARLLQEYGTPEAVFRASPSELEALRLPASAVQALTSGTALKEAEAEIERARTFGASFIHWEEARYPKLLREIYDPPPLLYVRGDADVLARHAVAIVGTRRPTPYGNLMSERLARDLADRGLVVVSGLARGIDSSAHRGALESARGTTVAVLGNGVDVVYPKENRKLLERIAERGALVSEFPLGTMPTPDKFPVRNRIIAGMALGVVVVEGAQYSGSFITARLAMEFGREVYGVPGPVTQPVSFAPNQLIKQGAKLVTGWQDVVEELPTALRAELFPVEDATPAERASLLAEALPAPARRLYELLATDEARHVDELVEQSAMSSSEVLSTLFELEMKGVVRQLPGKQFVRVLL
ncbi:MAG: DNA-processing protein DprA [Firmicutes bacterium]|nr:DNA-processing protein DprA [Bacillota bacterium]